MGKIQELHALLDAAVSESDVAPAIRLAQNETNRVAAEAVSSLAETEVLEISRLLIRLGIASVALKGAVVAGRAYGDLLGKCAARVPALGNFYSDFGCTVVCLLQAFAEGGPAVWASASLEFNHAMLGGICCFCLMNAVDLLLALLKTNRSVCQSLERGRPYLCL